MTELDKESGRLGFSMVFLPQDGSDTAFYLVI